MGILTRINLSSCWNPYKFSTNYLFSQFGESFLLKEHSYFYASTLSWEILQFFMNNSWIRKCDKIKIILFDVFSSCFTNQNSSFSWDFMVPVRILPPYCQKLFLRSRHLLDGILRTDNFSQAWKVFKFKKVISTLWQKSFQG